MKYLHEKSWKMFSEQLITNKCGFSRAMSLKMVQETEQGIQLLWEMEEEIDSCLTLEYSLIHFFSAPM